MNTHSLIRICLLSDNDAEIALLRKMVEEEGRGRVVIRKGCRRLGAAVEQLGREGEFDLVLTALSLPDSQGLETLRRLAQAAPRLPAIVVGTDDELLAMRAIGEGAQDYLVKDDLSARSLVRAARHAVERKRIGPTAAGTGEERPELRKQLDEALKRLHEVQAGMTQQERLHAFERMASGIAHDFNNALSPILAHTERLLSQPFLASDPEKFGSVLLKIYDAAEQCATIVARLREFSRPRDEVAPFQSVDLKAVLSKAISLTQPSWKDQARARGATVRIVSDFDEARPVFGAANELRELFVNLLLNSIDAITLYGEIFVTAFMEGDCVCVRVEDTGIGMTEEIGARCMEPFFTTKEGVGSGLGLGVVYGIAQRHEAEITIESQAGAGTQVTVRFPPFHPAPRSAGRPPVRGLRVLVAEDEPTIREVLALCLAEDCHSVEFAEDGAAALDKLVPGRFDLLITDRSMPEMSGDQLACEARARDGAIRILLLTGFVQSAEVAGLKVDAYVPKPFTFESVRLGIAEAMEPPRSPAIRSGEAPLRLVREG